MWQRILGAIGVLWGGALLVQHVVRARNEHFNGTLMAGRAVAYVLAGLVFLGGLFLLVRPRGRGAG